MRHGRRMAPSNAGRAAIVTTLRNAEAVLDSFIAYHLAIGFDHIFLFFDDPADRDLPRAAAHPAITAIPHDSDLRRAWTALPHYCELAEFVDTEVMARQSLNAFVAMDMARDRGLDWLLHIDADELFYSPRETAAAHFAQLQNGPFDSVIYLNHEAVPEQDCIDDFFREVDLFKVLPSSAPHTPEAIRLVSETPQLRPSFYHFYANGKSAVRLSATGMQPSGVHRWMRSDGTMALGQSAQHFILHYACCGFDSFWTKYVTLGRFADKWWNKDDITSAIGPLHVDARDIVASGDREAARAFYRSRIAMSDRGRVSALTDAGVLTRVAHPRAILNSVVPAREH
jgi:hypothetical protein